MLANQIKIKPMKSGKLLIQIGKLKIGNERDSSNDDTAIN
jgi:hypothetical protein